MSTTGTPPSCTASTGHIEGDVWWSTPPNANPVADVTITLRSSTGEALRGRADGNGHFSIEVESGSWLVGAEVDPLCLSETEIRVELAPCGLETVTLVMGPCAG